MGYHSRMALPRNSTWESDRHTSCRSLAQGHHLKLLNILGTRQLTETRNLSFLPRAKALHMVIASAAAVASSSRDELDSCMDMEASIWLWCKLPA